MRLIQLCPEWLKVENERLFRIVAAIGDADGVSFQCPVCHVVNQGPVGTHSVICWRPRVPQTITPTPGRWEFEGAGFDDLTLVAGSSSIQLLGGCNAHFWIRNGEIVLA